MRRILICAAALAVQFVYAAELAKWTDNASTVVYWTNVLNWVDADGINLLEPPTNGTHEVVFDPLTTDRSQEMRLESPPWQGADSPAYFGLYSISDIGFAGRRTVRICNKYAADREYKMEITVTNPDGFAGNWKSDYGQVGFRLPATSGKTPHLSNISAKRRVYVDVPTAGTKACLESVNDHGALEKRGEGELHVKATKDSDTLLYVSAGTLTIEGVPSSHVDGDLPVPGAWLHLDATRADTMRTFEGDDGRLYVTNWADANGNGNFAWFDFSWTGRSDKGQTTESSPPFLVYGMGGNSVVDFGRSSSGQSLALGPVSCWMKLSERKSGIYEVFYAGCYRGGSTVIPGDYVEDYPFHRASASVVRVDDTDLHNHPVRFGDIIFNGEPSDNGAVLGTDPHVLAVGVTNSIRLGALGSERMLNGRVGGCWIGEFVLYTNRLTRAQRMQVSNYLMRKWRNDGFQKNREAEILTLGTGAAIGVPEGRKARIGEITAESGTLLKKGDGTLEIGSVSGLESSTVSVNVQGGTVRFKGHGTVDTDAPAADPYLWLDATAESSFVFTNKENDVRSYIAEWHDRRPGQTGVYAKIPYTRSDYVEGAWAYRVENAFDGKAAVDFGDFGVRTDSAAFMDLSTGSANTAYEAFIAMKFKTSDRVNLGVFGSDANCAFRRAVTDALLHPNTGIYKTRNAIWTLNGAPVDPCKAGQGRMCAGEFHVVSVSGREPLAVNLLGGKDRIGQGSGYGGEQVAEQILYNRRLTDAERRQTVAYLMKRWRGVDAAVTGPVRLAAMSFRDDVNVELHSETAVDVSEICGGNGNIVKKGAGTFTIHLGGDESVSSCSVTEGTLELNCSVTRDAAFHFDASDTETLEFYVTGDGTVTNVTSVADVRRNGLVAEAWINDPNYDKDGKNCAITFTNPVLRAMSMPDGRIRQVFDFGRKTGYGWATQYPETSGFRMSGRFTGILEAHTICADNSSKGTFFGDITDHHYMRGSGLFSDKYASSNVTNGYIAVDGTEVAPTYLLGEGFHLVSVSPLGVTSISTLGIERENEAGGLYMGEQIGFTNRLSSACRKFLQDHLKHKWLGASKPVWPYTVGTVGVAAGAVFKIDGGVSLGVGKITGGGTIEGSVVGVAEIEVACVGGATVPVAINGDISFAESVTITLVGDTRSLGYGEYPLVTGAGENKGGTSWVVEGISSGKKASVRFSDGTLRLRLIQHGMSLSFR